MSQSIRKAAVLVRSLDPEAAAALVAQLDVAEARALRKAIQELGAVEDNERAALLAELSDQESAESTPQEAVELELSGEAYPLPEKSMAAESDKVEKIAAKDPTSPSVESSSPFAWVDEGDLPTLAERLAREQVSTIALVLSLLPPERAGGLLAELPSHLQSESLERLADLGDIDPTNLELVERDLETWLREHKACQRRRESRQTTVRAILQNSPSATRDRVVSSLERVGAPWLVGVRESIKVAAQSLTTPPVPTPPPTSATATTRIRPGLQVDALRQRMKHALPTQNAGTVVATEPQPEPIEKPTQQLPPFASLALLDAASFASVLRACGIETLVRAAAGADDQFLVGLRRWLPASHCRELQKRAHSLTGIRISDIDRAQQELVATAARLCDEGAITWSAYSKLTASTS